MGIGHKLRPFFRLVIGCLQRFDVEIRITGQQMDIFQRQPQPVGVVVQIDLIDYPLDGAVQVKVGGVVGVESVDWISGFIKLNSQDPGLVLRVHLRHSIRQSGTSRRCNTYILHSLVVLGGHQGGDTGQSAGFVEKEKVGVGLLKP